MNFVRLNFDYAKMSEDIAGMKQSEEKTGEVDMDRGSSSHLESMKDASNDSWSARYRDVVWVKFDKSTWWPSYVYDPKLIWSSHSISRAKVLAEQAKGKYTVYYYGDRSFGFISAKDMKPYNESTKRELAHQKIGKRYEDSYANSIQEADQDILLDKNDRLKAYFEMYGIDRITGEELVKYEENTAKMDDDEELPQEVQAPRRRGRPPKNKSAHTEPSTSKVKEGQAHSKEGENEGAGNDKEGEEDEENDESEHEEQQQEEEEQEFDEEFSDDDSEFGVKRKPKRPRGNGEFRRRGRPPKNINRLLEQRRHSEESNGVDIGSPQGVPSGTKKRGRPAKKSEEAAVAPALVEPPKVNAKAILEGESEADRLKRLTAILRLTTDPTSYDESRALKTLEKLKSVSDI